MSRVKRVVTFILPFLLFLLAVSSCTSQGRYTSLDLALLPCEYGNQLKFFKPIEFKSDGSLLYPKQKDEVINDLNSGSLTDLVVFIHGWNKSPVSAERDYQDFLCRLHGKLPLTEQGSKREGNWKILGVFWPSTISNKPQEPLLIKPISYYKIRNRVDNLAEEGLAELMKELFNNLVELDNSRGSDNRIRLHLIGHSFGGRMIISSLKKLSDDGDLVPILNNLESTNVILINAAAPPSFFSWVKGAVAEAWKLSESARFTSSTSSYLLNIHSEKDLANKVLFRIASTFNSDEQSCAVGACGIPDYPTLCVDHSGKLIEPEENLSKSASDINIKNIDATNIVFDHSDIYKGRIASLVADLLYDKRSKRVLGLAASPTGCL
jgi:hypothetical protein